MLFNIFNELNILSCRNVRMIQEVRTMMKSLKLEESVDTYTAIARALAFNMIPESVLQEMEKAANMGIQFKEEHIMEIVKTLASMGDYLTIPKVFIIFRVFYYPHWCSCLVYINIILICFHPF